MSWLYSRALVEEYLAGSGSDGAPFALSSVNPTPQAYLSPDKMTVFSRPSQFGMTFAPLTDGPGADLLTWFLEASRARTSAQREKGQESPGSDPGYGLNSHESLAKYDPDTCLWKIHQYSLLGGLELYLETWPRWGLMLDGECWEQQTLVRHIKGTESGSLPTPTAASADKEGVPSQKGDVLIAYARGVKLWPTPTVCGNYNRKGASKTSGDGLATSVFATLTRRDYRSGKFSLEAKAKRDKHSRGTPLNEQIGGLLNPMWVEWLMGWPLGWTDLKPLVMDKFHNARRRHGDC